MPLVSVNALSGLLSFLPDYGDDEPIARQSVNALSGLLSFLHCPAWRLDSTCSLCQCPKRATLISTVPSENPCKHWLSSLIFAGICRNILTTSIFHPFLGLFTICSYLSLPSLLFNQKNYTSLPTKIKAFFHTNVMLSHNYNNVHTTSVTQQIS